MAEIDLDYESYSTHDDILSNYMSLNTGTTTITSKQKALTAELHISRLKLQVDYESFLIFACLLMDKIPRIYTSIFTEDPDVSIKSFHGHKEYFLKKQNIPYSTNENYARESYSEKKQNDLR